MTKENIAKAQIIQTSEQRIAQIEKNVETIMKEIEKLATDETERGLKEDFRLGLMCVEAVREACVKAQKNLAYIHGVIEEE